MTISVLQDTELIWIIPWVLNHLPTLFTACCFSTQNVSYTSSLSMLSRNSFDDIIWLPIERRKPHILSLDGQIVHVSTSFTVSVSLFSYDTGMLLPTSLSLESQIPPRSMTNSNATFAATLSPNFLASSELSEQLVCPSYSFLVWRLLFLSNFFPWYRGQDFKFCKFRSDLNLEGDP